MRKPEPQVITINEFAERLCSLPKKDMVALLEYYQHPIASTVEGLTEEQWISIRGRALKFTDKELQSMLDTVSSNKSILDGLFSKKK